MIRENNLIDYIIYAKKNGIVINYNKNAGKVVNSKKYTASEEKKSTASTAYIKRRVW